MDKPRNLEQDIMDAQINLLGGCLFSLTKVFLIGSAVTWYFMTYSNQDNSDSSFTKTSQANISNYSQYKP